MCETGVRYFDEAARRKLVRRLSEMPDPDDDPLGLFEAAARRVRQRAFLLDPARVYAAACERIRAHAAAWEGAPALEHWTQAHVDAAIAALIAHDAVHGAPSDADEFVAESFGLTPDVARRAPVAFNALEAATRSAFFALLVENQSVAECAAVDPQAAATRVERARVALWTVLLGDAPVDGARDRSEPRSVEQP